MVHDQSSTGSTVFIEPLVAVRLNNEYRELVIAEQQEITKILAALSALLTPCTAALLANQKILAALDFVFAKARLASSMQASKPLFNTERIVEIKDGRHPLIPRDKVVPIGIRIGDDFTLLIITGPNTGGKTVSLKTMGLFTLMGQAGLHIPAFQGSRLAVFRDVFADIGDEQSIARRRHGPDRGRGARDCDSVVLTEYRRADGRDHALQRIESLRALYEGRRKRKL